MNNHLKHIDNKLFGARLKAEREKRNLSLGEMTSLTGLPKSSLSYYENGNAVPSLDKTFELAEFYGVSIDYLTGRDELKDSINSVADIAALILRLYQFDCVGLFLDNEQNPILAFNNEKLNNFLKENFDSITKSDEIPEKFLKTVQEGIQGSLLKLENDKVQKR